MVEVNITHSDVENFEKKEKKKKPVTLYLTGETFDFVKKNLSKGSISSLVDDILKQIKEALEKRLEEQDNKTEEKESDNQGKE